MAILLRRLLVELYYDNRSWLTMDFWRPNTTFCTSCRKSMIDWLIDWWGIKLIQIGQHGLSEGENQWGVINPINKVSSRNEFACNVASWWYPDGRFLCILSRCWCIHFMLYSAVSNCTIQCIWNVMKSCHACFLFVIIKFAKESSSERGS